MQTLPEKYLYIERTDPIPQTPPTIFVGSLSSSTTERELKRYFSSFGKVTRAKLILDIENGKSKQCALIFVESLDTVNSILACSDHFIDGRLVRVDIANDDRKHTKCFVENTLFIGNIKLQTTEASVRSYFENIGKVIGLKIFKLSENAKSLNAIINFGSNEPVAKIMSRPNKHKLDGRHLRCSFYKPKLTKDAFSITDLQESMNGDGDDTLNEVAHQESESYLASSRMDGSNRSMKSPSMFGNFDNRYQDAIAYNDLPHHPNFHQGYNRSHASFQHYQYRPPVITDFTNLEAGSCQPQPINGSYQPWKDKKWRSHDLFVLAVELETDPLFLTFCSSLASDQR